VDIAFDVPVALLALTETELKAFPFPLIEMFTVAVNWLPYGCDNVL
jgi:hypothetical protein